MILKRTIKLLKEYLRMNNLNVIELTNVNKYRQDKINKIRDYFKNEIKERKDIIKKRNKYLVSFDYLDKIFIALSAPFSTLSIASYATVLDIVGSSLTLIFTIGTSINKSLLRVTKKSKKKHNKIIALAKRKDIIKKRNKYLLSFDYLDKIFIALSASLSTLSIASYATVLGIAGSSLTLIFTIVTSINKSLLRVTEKRKKKHNKIIALAKSKLNMIDTLLSSALNDSKISHEEFTSIITEKNIYENIKENIKDTAELSSLEHIEDKSTTFKII